VDGTAESIRKFDGSDVIKLTTLTTLTRTRSEEDLPALGKAPAA
jgi:hypothetical protein